MTPVTPNPALLPPGPAPGPSGRQQAPKAPSGPAFSDVLREQTRLQFSGHALQRIQRRGIDVSKPTLTRLQGGLERAAAKGSRDAVVLVDQTAFVVSVRNRTVITAVDNDHMKDHVFTNIDSAVIA